MGYTFPTPVPLTERPVYAAYLAAKEVYEAELSAVPADHISPMQALLHFFETGEASKASAPIPSLNVARDAFHEAERVLKAYAANRMLVPELRRALAALDT